MSCSSAEDLAFEPRKVTDIGNDPGKNKKRAEYFKFCGTAQKAKPRPITPPPTKPKPPTNPKPKPPPKKGKGKSIVTVEEEGVTVTVELAPPAQGEEQDIDLEETLDLLELWGIEEDDIVTFVPPAGYTDVAPGRFGEAGGTTGGLYSDGFGTCVGFGVKGTASNGKNHIFLAHMLTGSWPSMRSQWTAFANAIEASGVTNTRGIMYTVDTRASNPELADPYMKTQAADEETDYIPLYKALKDLVPSSVRAYHPFGKVGTMRVDAGGTSGGIVTNP